MSYKPGEVLIDKYWIEEIVGQGAFGVVYRATDLMLKATRALKVLQRDTPGLGSTVYGDYKDRFMLEAQLGAKFNHQNIIQVHSFEQNGDDLILVMEYAAEGNLASQIDQARVSGKTIPIKDAIQIAIDEAEGLAALHALDVVHRDLKPSNILFDNQGHAKVADLGLAQIPGGPSMRSQLSKPAPHPGTPAYMSPEQANTTDYLTSASDIYSLGLVMFETLTGHVYRSQRPGTRASELRKEVPVWLDELIIKMLAEDPKERPWNGKEVAGLFRSGLEMEIKFGLQGEAKLKEAERKAARKLLIKKSISEFLNDIRSTLTHAIPILRFVVIIGGIILLLWGGSRILPHLLSFIPTAKPTPTLRPTLTPVPSTMTLVPTPTKTNVPTPNPTLTLTPISQSSFLLQEDFENNKVEGWNQSLGNWTIEKDATGNHYWSGSGPNNYPQIWYGDASTNWKDYAFESRIQFIKGDQLFICVRSDTGSAFYTVFLDNGYAGINYAQYNPSKGVAWKIFIDSAGHLSFAHNRWYTIRVEIKGSSLKTYVDNALVASGTLPDPIVNVQGGIGYYMTGGAEFYIDDIRVWTLK